MLKYLRFLIGFLCIGAMACAGVIWGSAADVQPHLQPARSDASQKQITGTWEGVLDAGAAKLKLIINITSNKDGSLTGTLDSPDQDARGLPMDSITFNHPALRFEMKSLAVIYEGQLSADGATIAGEFKQGGQAFSLSFKRTGETAAPTLLKTHKVDAGGHKLSFVSGGEGTPTVVLKPGSAPVSRPGPRSRATSRNSLTLFHTIAPALANRKLDQSRDRRNRSPPNSMPLCKTLESSRPMSWWDIRWEEFSCVFSPTYIPMKWSAWF